MSNEHDENEVKNEIHSMEPNVSPVGTHFGFGEQFNFLRDKIVQITREVGAKNPVMDDSVGTESAEKLLEKREEKYDEHLVESLIREEALDDGDDKIEIVLTNGSRTSGQRRLGSDDDKFAESSWQNQIDGSGNESQSTSRKSSSKSLLHNQFDHQQVSSAEVEMTDRDGERGCLAPDDEDGNLPVSTIVFEVLLYVPFFRFFSFHLLLSTFYFLLCSFLFIFLKFLTVATIFNSFRGAGWVIFYLTLLTLKIK